jgi:ATP-dependent RNA helicase RhlE
MPDTFAELPLHDTLLATAARLGYATPTKIQSEAIPHLVKGLDLLGIAQTGTGKTATFGLPILHRLHESGSAAAPGLPRALILAPTRELATQIWERISEYAEGLDLRVSLIQGGIEYDGQIEELAKGVHLLVATPGRLLDLLQQDKLTLDAIETFVLDEADRMLDLGFIDAVHEVHELLPKKHQSLLFSATMPDAIARLAKKILWKPTRVEAERPGATIEGVHQSIYYVEPDDKLSLLGEILNDEAVTKALVFCRTRKSAEEVADYLLGFQEKAEATHSGRSQEGRDHAMSRFRDGTTRILVASDVAARGLDVHDITHVINFHVPEVPETYVHRVGRTGRAGASGIAITMCAIDERKFLRDIEGLIRRVIEPVTDHPYHSSLEVMPEHLQLGREAKKARTKQQGRPRKSRRRSGRKRS